MIQETSDCEEEDVSSNTYKVDSLNLNSFECWDYALELECLKGPEDLQLAAELGKTLLERNKELEISLRECQNVIDDQAQEIQYLTKQSAALRKANDNRIRMYEHLEVSIQELERANQRLAVDNATDKKQIKSLYAYRDMLESRCEELQKALDEARLQQTTQKEKLRRISSAKSEDETAEEEQTIDTTTHPTETSMNQSPPEEEIISQLSIENQELKNHMSREQRKIADLEAEICRRVQDMELLEEELAQREEQVNSLREKISNLEEIRSENLCVKCLREMDVKMPEEIQMLFDPEEDSFSHNGKYRSSVCLEVKEDNPYRTLANMYESIVTEQSENCKPNVDFSKFSSRNCLSLRDELKLFDFQKDREEDEVEKEENDSKAQSNAVENKIFLQTAADHSEAETSSSGYSEETSSKGTQTERNMTPGSFLCSIAEGDDCKFSIYDDACPIESRFRKIPEYRALFKEIYAVLKHAAEENSSGEQLPLLNDLTPVSESFKAPPATPAKELPTDSEDLQSLSKSSNNSDGASEILSTTDTALDETIKVPEQEDLTTPNAPGPSETQRDARQRNDFFEYISVSVGVKKKSKRKSNNSPATRTKVSEMVDKTEGSSPTSGRKSGRRRKEWKNFDSPITGSRNQSPAIQPHVLTTLERKETSPSTQSRGLGSARRSSWVLQTFVSTAAQEVAQLKKLEKSYAEVLRHRPPPKNFQRQKTFD